MGRLLVLWGFAVKNRRHRPAEALLLLLACAIATTYAAAKSGGTTVFPGPVWIALMVLDALVAVTVLTAIPSRLGGRRSAAEVLQAGAA